MTPICAIYQVRPFLFSVPSSLQAFLSTAVSSPVEESEAGFTGRRLNSKMQVYSGSKTAYLPKMMSLYQQCIRVLSNNIDCKYLSSSQTHCALKFWHLGTDPSSSPLLQRWDKSCWKPRCCRDQHPQCFQAVLSTGNCGNQSLHGYFSTWRYCCLRFLSPPLILCGVVQHCSFLTVFQGVKPFPWQGRSRIMNTPCFLLLSSNL